MGASLPKLSPMFCLALGGQSGCDQQASLILDSKASPFSIHQVDFVFQYTPEKEGEKGLVNLKSPLLYSIPIIVETLTNCIKLKIKCTLYAVNPCT